MDGGLRKETEGKGSAACRVSRSHGDSVSMDAEESKCSLQQVTVDD